MQAKQSIFFFLLLGLVLVLNAAWLPYHRSLPAPEKIKAPAAGRYLYVAVPGIRNYLGYGGHGLLVFDINNQHKFVKRIKTGGLSPDGKPSNVKGIAVSVPLNSLYISTLEALQRIDLTTEKVLWEKPFAGGADRMAISPDGKTMYLPSLEKDFWNVVDCATGNIITKIQVVKRAHNTLLAHREIMPI